MVLQAILAYSLTEWPNEKGTDFNSDVVQQELKTITLSLSVIESDTGIEPDRYSLWRKLMRIKAIFCVQFENSSSFRTVSASKPSQPRNELLT